MTATKYTFSISNDFPNSKENSSKLTIEIQASAIITALDHIDTSADVCDIWFKAALSQGDESVLAAVIAAHDGEPIPAPDTLPDGTPLVAIAQRQDDGIPKFALAPTTGSEYITASHNFCDKCSWFGDSERVTNETLSDSGDGYTFESVHPFWIDMISGRVHNDDKWVQEQIDLNPGDPHGYSVIIKVNDVIQTMREPFETSGGDYEVLWEDGYIVFFSDQSGNTVTADYSYANGSTFYLRPTAGTILRILDAEADITLDAIMTDSMEYGVWGVADVFAPELGLPSGTMIPLANMTYKRMQQIVAEAKGTYPVVEAVGASEAELLLSLNEFRRKSRGTRAKVSALPFKYSTSRDLSSAALMEIRVKTAHDRVFGGDSVTVTFYCVSMAE